MGNYSHSSFRGDPLAPHLEKSWFHWWYDDFPIKFGFLNAGSMKMVQFALIIVEKNATGSKWYNNR